MIINTGDLSDFNGASTPYIKYFNTALVEDGIVGRFTEILSIKFKARQAYTIVDSARDTSEVAIVLKY